MVSDWIAAYEDYLKTEKQASANTVSSYLRDVRQFAAAMEEQERPLAQVTPMEVEGYIHQLTVLGKSPATVTRSLASIKSFYNYLLLRGQVTANPAKSVAPAKVERKLPQILTSREVELFLAQLDP